MERRTIVHLYRVTTVTTLTAIAFWKFYDLTKHGRLGEINPFAEDPYDAVGSFAFQIALLVGVLNYARALRLTETPRAVPRARLIARGNFIVLASIGATLVGDALALILHPLPHSDWARGLLLALGLMSILFLACLASLIAVLRRVSMPPPPSLTPADALEDLWTPVRVFAIKARRILPRGWVDWVKESDCERLFAHLSWAHPRHHPWRFACFLSGLAGVAIYIAKLSEGPAPSFRIALLVAIIFVTAEAVASLLGFVILGAYLGLRPPIRRA